MADDSYGGPIMITRCPVHKVLTSRTGEGRFTLKCWKCVAEAARARIYLERVPRGAIRR